MRTFALATLFAAVSAMSAEDAAAELMAEIDAAMARTAQLTCDSYFYTIIVTNEWSCTDEYTCEKYDADGFAMIDTVSKSAPRIGAIEAVAADYYSTPPIFEVPAFRGYDNMFDTACVDPIVPGEVLGVYD